MATGTQSSQTSKVTQPKKQNPTLLRKVQSSKDFHSQSQPHTPDQDLTHFGTWTSDPIWVPPKESAAELAVSMLNRIGTFTSKKKLWQDALQEHRSSMTQVREIELPKASIRLPKGKLFVTVTDRKNFDQIEDDIPRCVQTRLDEFLAGPGKKRGVKVYYLKPLCVEVGSDLIFTTAEEVEQILSEIKSKSFAQYRRKYLGHRAGFLCASVMNACLAIPRWLTAYVIMRKKREIDAYHAKVEFERRKRAYVANEERNKFRTDKSTFDEFLSMTEPPAREDVIDHYIEDQRLSELDRQIFLAVSSLALPAFLLSVAALKMAAVAAGSAVFVCDPAFVAEMPGSNGQLLKIGHFDEVDGVVHVEI